MTAEIVSVGTELLLGQITDTNAVSLSQALAEAGIACRHRHTVGDNLDRLVAVLQHSLRNADIVITIGGLGPTEDDLTREGISAALEDPLVEDATIAEHLKQLFTQRGIPWLDRQLHQAMRPENSRAVPNPNGTAPGLICEKDGKVVIAMPGPRGEFIPMLNEQIRPYLETLGGGDRIRSRVVKTCGMGESSVEEKVRPLLQGENPTVAPLAHLGEVHLRITGRSPNAAELDSQLNEMEARIRGSLGDSVFGVDDDTLESAVLQMLRERGETVSVAESCTGGLLGGRLTSVPGSSDVFMGGFITYSNEMKVRMLGVPTQILETSGAVSEECAREMAVGCRFETESDWAVSITGIAGPDGGTPEKPVGLVYIGVADAFGTVVVRNHFIGTREDVRRRSTQAALTLLRRTILRGGCASS